MPPPHIPLVANALCTIGDVKAIIDPELKPDADVLLAILINGLSVAAEGEHFCNRKFQKRSYTEYYHGGTYRVFVQAPPIQRSPAIAVYDDPDRVYGAGTLLEQHTDYMVDYQEGLIRKFYTVFSDYSEAIKVVYTGGLVLYSEQNQVLDAPWDLRQAAAMQVSFLYKNRENLGLKAIQAMGGGVTMYQPTDLLPAVAKTFLSYRRHD